MAGCYVISGKKMDQVKGTYKLASSTYTPSHERKADKTPISYDYVNDEKYQYEDYLIVTGTSAGYYVHKEANAPAYVKEVRLSYEYNAEDASIVEYVIYNDAFTITQSINNGNHLGVNHNTLNFSRPSFDYTELFTKRPMRSEDRYVRWEKVDNATDLSYVKEQIPDLKEYDYQSFAVRGIYEVRYEFTEDIPGAVLPEFKYSFFVIDPDKNAMNVSWYYADNESPETQIVSQFLLQNPSGDWNTITIDGETYTLDASGNYHSEENGIRITLARVSNNISNAVLDSLILSYLPEVTE
jgi:hypothetical protein